MRNASGRDVWRPFRLSGKAAGWLLLAVPLVAGCGGDDAGLVTANGTVTLDGQPLANAQVIFEHEKGPVYGRTDDNGRYELEFSTTRRGAFPGMNNVRINTNVVFDDADDAEEDEDDAVEAGLAKSNRLPARYNDESELSVEVASGGAPYDFDLTSD